LLFALRDGPSPFPGQWIYLADPVSPIGRVTNFSAWAPADRKPAKTILCFEFWCDPSQSIWKAGSKELSDLALSALGGSNVEARGFEATKIVRKANAFPVLQRGYQERLRPVNRWIEEIHGLQTAGRFGAFANSGVHESMLLGMEVADAVLCQH
jgi:protoporphyrinogen oxidase